MSDSSSKFSEDMSGSGKPLLGLWLYRSGEEWNYKEESPIALKQVRMSMTIFINSLLNLKIINIIRKTKYEYV